LGGAEGHSGRNAPERFLHSDSARSLREGKSASRVSGRNDSAGSERIVLRPCHPERSRASLLFRRVSAARGAIEGSLFPCLRASVAKNSNRARPTPAASNPLEI